LIISEAAEFLKQQTLFSHVAKLVQVLPSVKAVLPL
jgi:hypothetical protein